MKRLLVATDLSERSDRAIDRAILLAKRFAAQLNVLHVIDNDLPASVADQQKQAATGSIQAHLASIPGARDIDVTLTVEFGKDWAGILRQADTDGVGLIILGLHRERGLAGLFRGTTVERVIRNGDVPVLVVKNRAVRGYKTIVVGVDFSVYARRAVEFALRFAPNARVFLVHAFEVPFKAFVSGPDAHATLRKRDEQQFSRMIDEEMTVFLAGLEAERDRIEKVVLEGDPHGVLYGQVAALDADLLVMGTHGRTGMAHALLGSVAEGFLTDPPCDVVAVKAW